MVKIGKTVKAKRKMVFLARLSFVALQIVIVILVADGGSDFVYQGF